ncbi:hypothetical protein O181_060587 [Austropuccinia psidii MF-1]|uniref:Uncharacterized protein n=1 Tax=Austropuccinia psidii MF-1 TaxID=1389203 RepID=A0A9Q3HYK3_9BASI|nr:hypothetical protein [Austropuccinia psidii MF-1]
MAKEFFDAIKARCCPGSRFQKLQVVKDLLDLLIENDTGQHKPNSTVILSLRKTFVIFKKLGINGDKLEGLLAQAACHPPASLDWVAFDQLVTSAKLAKGDKKPWSMFIGQVILNASTPGPSPPPLFAICSKTFRVDDRLSHHQGFRQPESEPPSPGPFRTPRPATPDRQSQHLSSPPYQ